MGGVANIAANIGAVRSGMGTIAPREPLPTAQSESGARIQHGSVLFKDVTFNYPNGERVLERLTFRVEAKQSLGIVGLSGAGKTTILNLISGLFEPMSGSITIDGHDTRTMSDTDLLAGISVVTQEPSVFDRSVRENLLYGRPTATETELKDALRAADAAEFVTKLVDSEGRTGFDAYVGERGVRLSGGQRQRIAIARALLKDAAILILDEPTASLDAETEASVKKMLRDRHGSVTLLVIAHRMATVADLDRIVVVDRGMVVEEGTHEELVGRRGLYRRFWQLQSAGGSIG